MCKYKYHEKESEKDTPCQLQYYFSLLENGEVLPLDDSGYCVFHSENIEWKRENNFSDYLDKLFTIINLIDTEKINYDTPVGFLDPNGLFDFDLKGIRWIAKTSSDEKENTISIKNLKFSHYIALNMNGGHFYDELEIEKINDNLAFIFSYSTFEKMVSLKSSILKEISFEHCRLNAGFYMGNNCEIKGQSEFLNMTVQNNFSISSSTFCGETYFNDSIFGTDCIVSFDNVIFGERVNFSSCIFNDYATIENCQFDGEVFFTDSEFNKESHIHSNEFEGNVYFKSNKDSNKMFNDILYLYVKDENLGGVIYFENIDFLQIAPAEKENLLKLEKSNKVKIGKGCIKYRVQSPVINIKSEQINHNIIIELTTSFSNYFLYSNGFNLGIEFVSKEINNLSLFYYTDENISIEEFISRLKLTEREYWNFSMQTDKPLDKIKSISIIDNFASKLSVLLKIAFRKKNGFWTDEETKEMLKSIPNNNNYNERLKQINLTINVIENSIVAQNESSITKANIIQK